ncbi:MAG: cytochrome c maturation protein CcmE [Gammaproteobacteria bacterium]|nr:cytochrome c maturation protein CcmE [Gammaproteobacteria bacterium]NND38349.1 cytochrome c maturation protein CcmE [Pseudomonadales bacterium]MBT8150571.1 cytochrome c maturation protein CcmE [Gammaproteobacteria bacterium]NNL11535.1 cytochrome c maturation protein CcmE [Pseudomonadales bacterium]NNM12339.1 cytochrome c maturation protein CcmE [Pseudomonadales bacterium]
MHPVRRQRLMIVVMIVVGASLAAVLIGMALKENLNLFYEPVRVAAGEAPLGRKIRVGGMVVKDSVVRDTETLQVSFVLTDYSANVLVTYQGILPDLFAEEAGAVTTGVLGEDGVFRAEQVLAKHDEKYMPPEVAKAIEGKHPPDGAAGSY